MTTLGGIARRLSDGLLGLLSSQCGAGGSQRSSGTDTRVGSYFYFLGQLMNVFFQQVPVVGGTGLEVVGRRRRARARPRRQRVHRR